jgi:hypothetical protein
MYFKNCSNRYNGKSSLSFTSASWCFEAQIQYIERKGAKASRFRERKETSARSGIAICGESFAADKFNAVSLAALRQIEV